MYEDLGLLSSDSDLGEDLNKLFNQLSGFAPLSEYKRLLVAPRTLRSGLLERIDREIANQLAGKPAGIRLKLNSILDEEFIEALYRASQSGVKIDLIVRGICAIRSGIPGVSENIKIRSLLGRFLEHSRIFHFINAGDDEIYIGSADLMDRNLSRRVESLVRIAEPEHKASLIELLDEYLSDEIANWQMLQNGKWQNISKNSDGSAIENVQQLLIEKYRIGQ
jgi:polyphosphate kinase